ncbi:MAG: TonB C-terminal domain-containing protein [Pseudomonadales bacterium]|nr:TonB C-terminal domain-containing protein [Pseudomonadales bacterium]
MSRKTTLAKRLPLIMGVLAIIFALLLGFFIKGFLLDDQAMPKRIIQQITLIAPPPPPPPPPTPPEQEREPDIQEQATDEPLDDAMPDDMPDALAGDDLGIDGEGVAGGDGFGLVARKGGRGLLGGGNGYTAIIQSQITDMLADDDALRFLDYTVVLQIWVAKTGSIERFNFTSFSGDEQTKKRLKNLLASLEPFESGPPIEMPQPIKLRIRSQL